MAKFSVGEAAGAGFGVIKRHPGAIVMWAALYILLGLGPVFVMFGALGPDLMQLMHQTGGGAKPDPQLMARLTNLHGRIMSVKGIAIPCGIALQAILSAAVMRAVIEPSKSAFGYLRLGAQEFWLVLVYIALMLVMFLVILAVAIPVALVAAGLGVAGHHVPTSAGPVAYAMPAVIIIALLLILWVGLRLSMAAPMTFANRKFMLLESWKLTKGQGLRLFAVVLALFGIVILCELAVFAVLGLIGGIAFATQGEHLRNLFQGPPSAWAPAIGPQLALNAVVVGLIGSMGHTIFLAPWAAIYVKLSAKPRGPADFG